ncbi:YicC/YloC family endoribonuclease [Amphibacillus cookii]|uniref:YicC/YloC family endoribonuclease n=1 Tax=Amphibacillus cookii TaxID=767787 RepID=UPI001958EA5B|nr:YicC/YloC family endoribonuclease [Amphibacillus cookii]MBM7540519.1 uncharacterized protein (TIGR00255 family) [Amphibacillus cookii]
MVKSMTGYGEVDLVLDQTKIKVEIKSVNHRFLDLSIKMPRSIDKYEEQIKQLMRTYFIRGRIECYIHIFDERIANQTVAVNWSLLEQYDDALQRISNQYPDSAQALLTLLPELTDVFQIAEPDEIEAKLVSQMLDAVNSACQRVNDMREAEGSKLAEDVKYRIITARNITAELTHLREQVKTHHYERMLERLNALLMKQGLKQDERFYYELASLAEKGDLTEELVRIQSHIEQMETLLEQPNETGRKLDFIVQEMIREANTIGAKANDPSISEYVIELKATIEKIKEQVQNIE